MPTEGTLTPLPQRREGRRGEDQDPAGQVLACRRRAERRQGGRRAVTDDYPGESPWAFVGGTIHEATVDVAGEPWVDLEKEVAGAFARD